MITLGLLATQPIVCSIVELGTYFLGALFGIVAIILLRAIKDALHLGFVVFMVYYAPLVLAGPIICHIKPKWALLLHALVCQLIVVYLKLSTVFVFINDFFVNVFPCDVT